jgi:alginate O-acetyltransferase complex protein AlgI
MALGVARFFGIRLPQNFDSPLQASSIIDFWMRWHMTLTRFLTAYIYNPLTLWLTRRRLAKGLTGFGGGNTTIGAFIYLLMFPMLLTMFISGLWHGAGYGFIVWGLLHGLYLTINHAWRLIRFRLWSDKASYERLMQPVGQILTFTVVAATMVFFRSPTMASAIDLIKGLIGQNGVALSPALWSSQEFGWSVGWIFASMLIALAFPNTLQMLARYEPALGVKPLKAGIGDKRIIEWNTSLFWAIGVSIVAVSGVLSLAGPSQFLYWQF